MDNLGGKVKMMELSDEDIDFLENFFEEMFEKKDNDFIKKALKRIDVDADANANAALFKKFLLNLGGITEDMKILEGAVMAHEALVRINARKKE